VVVNAISYDGTSLEKTLIYPSSFLLIVTNPCATTTISAVIVSVTPITLSVWDLVSSHNTIAFSEFPDTASTTNSFPTMCPKTYSATVTTLTGGISLTTFSLDTSSKQFTVSS
jgi:hypothetical protein